MCFFQNELWSLQSVRIFFHNSNQKFNVFWLSLLFFCFIFEYFKKIRKIFVVRHFLMIQTIRKNLIFFVDHLLHFVLFHWLFVSTFEAWFDSCCSTKLMISTLSKRQFSWIEFVPLCVQNRKVIDLFIQIFFRFFLLIRVEQIVIYLKKILMFLNCLSKYCFKIIRQFKIQIKFFFEKWFFFSKLLRFDLTKKNFVLK